ncbi:MAG: monovalent cation/H+ antiporter complex subunit F [Lachnospiraceae bacterium]
MLENAYQFLFIGTIFILCIFIFLCFIRAVIGPKIADRIVAINMIGTMTIIIIAILAIYMEESYLLDVCLIYAMISFLAVIVLTKVYMGVYNEKKQKQLKEEKNDTDSRME